MPDSWVKVVQFFIFEKTFAKGMREPGELTFEFIFARYIESTALKPTANYSRKPARHQKFGSQVFLLYLMFILWY